MWSDLLDLAAYLYGLVTMAVCVVVFGLVIWGFVEEFVKRWREDGPQTCEACAFGQDRFASA